MTRWIWLLCSGCLVVVDPGDDQAGTTSGNNVLPLGEVHPCTVEVEGTTGYWTICFARDEHVRAFEHELMDDCAYNGIECSVQCSTRNLRPCAILCSGPPTAASACNASHGCYCPPE
jgi:hypothetical protein